MNGFIGPRMRIIDEGAEPTELWRLGEFFVHQQLRERFGWTFEQFVEKVRNGKWESIMAA